MQAMLNLQRDYHWAIPSGPAGTTMNKGKSVISFCPSSKISSRSEKKRFMYSWPVPLMLFELLLSSGPLLGAREVGPSVSF
ncbi:hypothetical protein ARMGADRAFT_1019646 [Armillaria gallica]|uniref:Uncharacterized protein n=1 Tax=Armillaria gallica TaxID=47427 RepID=A0A2H3CM89_ARMGA|nr:hypothetical protein ARMGADRAFT_1019646 [Armillaria gallica]